MLSWHQRWRSRLEPKLKCWGLRLLPNHFGRQFNARWWFSREGKYVMADEFRNNRLKKIILLNWMFYMANMNVIILP